MLFNNMAYLPVKSGRQPNIERLHGRLNCKIRSIQYFTNLYSKIKYNQQRLLKLNHKLKDLEEIRDTGNVRLCFGSNKLFRQQFNIGVNQNPFKSHEQWYEEFNYQRNKEFTLIGSKDESAGNLNAQITHIKDNLFNLKLNIHPHANKITDKYINLNFKIDYEVNTLINIIKNNK